MSSESIKPFTLQYSETLLNDLKQRLSLTRLPRALPTSETGDLGGSSRRIAEDPSILAECIRLAPL